MVHQWHSSWGTSILTSFVWAQLPDFPPPFPGHEPQVALMTQLDILLATGCTVNFLQSFALTSGPDPLLSLCLNDKNQLHCQEHLNQMSYRVFHLSSFWEISFAFWQIPCTRISHHCLCWQKLHLHNNTSICICILVYVVHWRKYCCAVWQLQARRICNRIPHTLWVMHPFTKEALQDRKRESVCVHVCPAGNGSRSPSWKTTSPLSFC